MMTKGSQPLDRLPRRAFTPAEAVSYGVTRSMISRLRASGDVEQLSRGLYARKDVALDSIELIEAAAKAPEATICLNSALAHHGLIDEIPGGVDLALPRGRTPPTTWTPVTWHLFDKGTFQVGRTTLDLAGGPSPIGLYTAERSIVDAFRLRSSAGYETANEALRNWLGRRGSRPSELLAVARQLPRAMGPLRQALDILQ